MDGVQLPQGMNHFEEAVYFFTTKFSEISGTHFIDLGRMKGWADLELHSGFEHGTLDWDSSALTSKPLWVAAVLWDNGNWINHWNSFEKTNFIPCAEELNSPIFP